jgi:AcrR family transcriptional regulator
MTKERDPTYADLLDQSRQSLLEGLAAAIEAHHRARQASGLRRPDDQSQRERASDFLFDFSRLNVEYLSQLSRVGSNYAILASSALERILTHFVPSKATRSEEVRAKAGQASIFSLRLANPFDEPATLQVMAPATFSPGRPVDGNRAGAGNIANAVSLSWESAVPPVLGAHQSMEIRAKVELTSAMPPGRDYWSTLDVIVTPLSGSRPSHTATIPIVVQRLLV